MRNAECGMRSREASPDNPQSAAPPPAPRVPAHSLVDRYCEQLFLTDEAGERDDNLIFVREWLLRGAEDRAALLELYERVRSGRVGPADEGNPLGEVLLLSGAVGPGGVRGLPGVPGLRRRPALAVRNRIYERVFDRRWVRARMPGDELRRQQAAF